MARVLVVYRGHNRSGYALHEALAAAQAGDQVALYLAGDAVNLAWERTLQFPDEFGQRLLEAWNAVRSAGVAVYAAADRVAYNRSEQQIADVGVTAVTAEQYVAMVKEADAVIPV